MVNISNMYGNHSVEQCEIKYYPHHLVVKNISVHIKSNTMANLDEKLANVTKLHEERGHYIKLQLRNNYFDNDLFTTLNNLPDLVGSFSVFGTDVQLHHSNWSCKFLV